MNRDAVNKRCLTNPAVGDYWHEMLCPVLVVVAVGNDEVTICKEKKEVDKSHWTWDLDKLETWSQDAFELYLLYEHSQDKTWATCCPEAHTWVVEELKEIGGAKE